MLPLPEPWWAGRRVWAALCLLLLGLPAAHASKEPPPPLDCAVMDCAGVLPGADRFEASEGQPYRVGRSADGEAVGWVVLSTDAVKMKGYSGAPLVTLVGLDPKGVITGARVIRHSEPILLVGIPESALTDFVSFYRGIPAVTEVVVGASPDPDAVTVDVISGATVTALVENETILGTARHLGVAVGVIEPDVQVSGHFVTAEPPWSWEEMARQGVFGRLTVSDAAMGMAGDDTFIDLWFTVADAPQIGLSLLGEREYAWAMEQLGPGEHLFVVLGQGSSSFKGSGFVRGGRFDRVRVEQGLRTIVFRDTDYYNLGQVAVDDAPEFDEGAVFVTRKGMLDPGAPFRLVFIGSRYDGKGGFSRQYGAFDATHSLPASVFERDAPPTVSAVSRQAWYNHRFRVIIVAGVFLLVIGLFAARRWTTGSMRRLQRAHVIVMVVCAGGLGFWLRAQPSITQVLTLIDAVVHEWRLDLFLSEPLLFVSWIGIAIVTLVWGRGVFCGWICPFGALTELLHKLGRALRLPLFELPDRLHRPLRFLRYVILVSLVAVFLYSPPMGERLAEIEPFKTTFFVAPWTREWFLLAWWITLMVSALVWWRPFCRYVCPMGAALALPSSLRISGPYRRRFCAKCHICTRGCEPRAIRPDGTIDPRECLSCMECEANFRDETVCPPLVGLVKLQEPGAQANAARLEKLREDARRC